MIDIYLHIITEEIRALRESVVERGKRRRLRCCVPMVREGVLVLDSEGREEVTESQASVLLIDDDEAVLTITQLLLESLGHNVLAMLKGRDALAVFEAEPARFDVIITDGLMPDLDGMKLAENILSIRPDMPVVLYTGFSPKLTSEGARSIGCRAFVTKPMTGADWSAVIRHVLNSREFYSKK
jgi:two-component system, cell cycle sensor histidine kinase and response regulator CckA